MFAEDEDMGNVDENRTGQNKERTNVRVIDTKLHMNVQFEQTPIKSDIREYNPLHATDDLKFDPIIDREPEIYFKFPAKLYKDKRKSSGYMKRFCCRCWLKMFDFVSYSKVR